MEELCEASGPAARGDAQEVQRLLALRANLAAVDHNEGRTAVHQAAAAGHVDVLRLLCSARADLRALDVRQLTPLHLAADAGQVDALRFLHSVDASLLFAPDGAGRAAVHRAAARGRINVLETLEDLGADLFAVAANGKTAAHYAAEAGQGQVLEWLPPARCRDLLDLTESILRGDKPIKSMWEKETPKRTWLADPEEEEKTAWPAR
mmetsp:Transcript_53239/g.119404  ORF Transcript_53239/g.119404 Transcript_53239/m.119404 type:complete len:207 (+) Transcript_53239:26-646(+)